MALSARQLARLHRQIDAIAASWPEMIEILARLIAGLATQKAR